VSDLSETSEKLTWRRRRAESVPLEDLRRAASSGFAGIRRWQQSAETSCNRQIASSRNTCTHTQDPKTRRKIYQRASAPFPVPDPVEPDPAAPGSGYSAAHSPTARYPLGFPRCRPRCPRACPTQHTRALQHPQTAQTEPSTGQAAHARGPRGVRRGVRAKFCLRGSSPFLRWGSLIVHRESTAAVARVTATTHRTGASSPRRRLPTRLPAVAYFKRGARWCAGMFTAPLVKNVKVVKVE